MNLRKVAGKLKGWNTVDDIRRKLSVSRGTALVYTHKLSKGGFVLQKIKKPRGTMYLIGPLPRPAKKLGMHAGTEFLSNVQEFSREEIPVEHKIPFFLSRFSKEKNSRYFFEAKRLIRKIRDWKRLYKYLKAYKTKKEFSKLYEEARRTVKKVPRLPKRYKKLIGNAR